MKPKDGSLKRLIKLTELIKEKSKRENRYT